METTRPKEQPKEKGKFSKSKIVNAAANVITAAGIGVASYAYGQSNATEQESDTQDSTSHNGAANNSVEPKDDEQIPNDDTQSVEVIQEDSAVDDTIIEPEPIASTDGIDFVVQVDEENNVVSIDSDEPIVPNIPEAELPTSDIAVIDEVDTNVDFVNNNDEVAINDNPNDFIGNDIQQDLLA